jgi:hypothetical protein
MNKTKIQLIITVISFTGYFMFLSAILYIEVSDNLNMETGENSMMGELQILLGVLTATIAQITNYWFGAGFINKKEPGEPVNAI